MSSNDVDVSTLSDEELRQAITYNGTKWGSYGYYIADEIKRALADRAGVSAYRDEYGKIRAYYKSPEQRKADAEIKAQQGKVEGS